MKKIFLLVVAVLIMALLAVPAFAVSSGDVTETEAYAAVSDEFVESPSRGDDPIPEPSDAPEPDTPERDAPRSPQTGTDAETAALLPVMLGVGAVGVLIAGKKKEKAS